MNVELLAPQPRSAPLEEAIRVLAEPHSKLLPFCEPVIEFCSGFSQAILRDRQAAGHPELVALAFWMRKAELIRLRDDFQRMMARDILAVPRGGVFHIPPANVDTIFVYSWLLSALAGNRNVIRLSPRREPQSELLLRIWNECFAHAPLELQSGTMVLSYGHDDEITRALSLACDVRVIWGGDATVSRIREFPLSPHARELTFPDRSSLAVLNARRYLELDQEGRARLAGQFFNDAYWFDQMACSSPSMVVWCGEEELSREASSGFWKSLMESVQRKGYRFPPAVEMRKLVFSCESILDLPVSAYRRDPAATILELESPELPPGEQCGGGFFYSAHVRNLSELAAILGRKHQTLTYFGFDREELLALARQLAGAAIDRIVPIGQALQFHRFWDGHDLLHEFCRFTYCQAAE